jgi:hypothetical protein
LAERLASASKDLHQGQGVVVLRGLDAAKFNDEEAVVAFAGICSYVCPQRATDSYANQTLSMSLIEFIPDHRLLTLHKAMFEMPPKRKCQAGQKTLV